MTEVLIPRKLATVEANGIRRFADPLLQAEVERFAGALPADRQVAALRIDMSKSFGGGVRVGEVFAYKINGEWSVMQGLAWSREQGVSATFGVTWSHK